MKNVDTGEKMGLRGILMEHGHNMDESQIKIVII